MVAKILVIDDGGMGFWPVRSFVPAAPGEVFLGAQGELSRYGSAALSQLFSGAAAGELAVLLSGKAVRARRIRAHVPVGGAHESVVGQSHVRAGLAGLQRNSQGTDQIVLYRQPVQYLADGQVGDGDPVGVRATELEIEAITLTSQLSVVASISAALERSGITLSDVVTPHTALCDVQAPTGAVRVHVRTGETILSAGTPDLLTVAASIPVGTRHMVQDVAALGQVPVDVACTDVFGLLEQPNVASAPAATADIVGARVQELVTFVQRALTQAGVTPVSIEVSVEGLPAEFISAFFERAMDVPCTALAVDWTFLASRAANLLASGPPLHTPARFEPDPGRAADGIWGWLRARF